MKTFIFATCAALFAGGVVYFGTDAAENGGSARIENIEGEKERTGSKSIISRYIASEDDEKSEAKLVENDNPYVVETSETHPHPPKQTEDEGIDEAPQSADADVKASVETASQSEALDSGDERIDLVETPSIGSQIAEQNNERSVTEIRKPKKASKKRARKVSSDDPAQMRIDAVFEQAENISQPDLRDRAYLDLVDYATSKGMFEEAERAALKIKQIELRDTARSRIAMGLARFGKSEQAFSLIEDVEIDELRDVMRLQVIEALLGTDGRR